MGAGVDFQKELARAKTDEERIAVVRTACGQLHERFSSLRELVQGLLPQRHEAKVAIASLESAYYTAIIGMIREHGISTDFIKNL